MPNPDKDFDRLEKRFFDEWVRRNPLLGTSLGLHDDYDELMYTASRVQGGSIQAAHAKLAARKQAVIDGYVASLGSKPAPIVPDPNGAPASGERTLKTFDQANEALDAWLANQA